MVKALKFLLPSALLAAAIFFACTKTTDDTLATEEAIDQALFEVQERGGLGSYGCYELVFPVTIQLPNGTTAEVNSYEEIAQKLRAYFEANGRPKRGMRPAFSFVFPISVVNSNGEVIVVENEQQLRQLRAECKGTFGNHGPNGHGHHGVACFEFVFPVTIVFPDGTTAQAENPRAMRQIIRTWKQNNPNTTERPVLQFPLQVKMRRTGEIITVNNADELAALKNSCK
ncbi:MAG: hypothetical protein RMJ33_12210 [Saprospiraceae bacterium]|nr:hypothetical protein [Saprospiraceae bacterium]MDW8230591.1 hypothetical protein [Saprospiraceae bacterium]